MKTAMLARVFTGATLCLLPATTFALTPEEAWEKWRAQAEESDVAVTAGGETSSGGTLTVTDVAFVQDFDEGTLSGTISEIVFADAGDDTVRVTMSEDIPMTVNGTDFDGVDYSVALTLSAPGLVYVASDGPSGGTDATYEAPEMSVVLDSFTEGGEPLDITVLMTATEIAGAYTVSGDEPSTIDASGTAASLTIDMNGSDPVEGNFSFDMSIDDISSTTSTVGMSMLAMTDDLEEIAESGASAQSQGSAGAIALDLSVDGEPDSFALQLSMSGAEGSGSIDASRVEYDVTYNDLDFVASGSEIPFPQVTGALGQSQTRISIPTGETEDAAPMSMLFALRDLSMGEELWSMFDPSGALPRDPATLVLDLAGQVRVLANIFGEEFVDSADMPFEAEQVDINELRLSLAGAELTGNGSVALDYSGDGPFGPGSPAPDGAIDLMLTGGQGLLDSLVNMGLIGQEEAMMARMFTGMLARPGDGPDTLISEITMQPDGTILANGAPLPF